MSPRMHDDHAAEQSQAAQTHCHVVPLAQSCCKDTWQPHRILRCLGLMDCKRVEFICTGPLTFVNTTTTQLPVLFTDDHTV